MAKKKFAKTATAKVPTTPLVYGGTDMYSDTYKKASTKKPKVNGRKK